MSSPPKPPYGELIEKARDDAGLSKREAARRAGISDAWWRYVTDGHQGETPVPGTADTVAAMARAVGLPPDRLETEGRRKDAADALRKMLREPPGRPLRAVAADPPATGVTPAERERDRLLAEYPDDEVLPLLAAQSSKKVSMVVAEMLDWLGSQGPWAPPQESNGTAG
jgi:transcriptional regulator with XRE-family HTH domain